MKYPPRNPRPRPGQGPPQPFLILRTDDRGLPAETGSSRWEINGWSARVEVWSGAQWVRMKARDRPEGVQVLGDGTRVLLRME